MTASTTLTKIFFNAHKQLKPARRSQHVSLAGGKCVFTALQAQLTIQSDAAHFNAARTVNFRHWPWPLWLRQSAFV